MMRNQSHECQLLIVKAAKAACNAIKDTEGATFPVKHVCLHSFTTGKLVR